MRCWRVSTYFRLTDLLLVIALAIARCELIHRQQTFSRLTKGPASIRAQLVDMDCTLHLVRPTAHRTKEKRSFSVLRGTMERRVTCFHLAVATAPAGDPSTLKRTCCRRIPRSIYHWAKLKVELKRSLIIFNDRFDSSGVLVSYS